MTSPDPAQLGYRWPAEWEPHAATWMSWPHNRCTWPGVFHKVPERFATLVQGISEYEPVHLLVSDAESRRQCQAMLRDAKGVTLHEVATNDAWIRDYGPLFLQPPRGRPPALLSWRYNAWGGKYPPFDCDDAVASTIGELTGSRVFTPDFILEGGAIEGNGAGALLSTAGCLLTETRNPGRTADDLSRVLVENFAATQVILLPKTQFAGDDTDGHVDQLARFANASTVLAGVSRDSSDVNSRPLGENRRFLEELRVGEERVQVVDLPTPAPIYHDGRRLPASYCNFYLTNGAVFAPRFGDQQTDRHAAEVLGEAFPDRDIKMFELGELLVGLGGIHCLTMQQPK